MPDPTTELLRNASERSFCSAGKGGVALGALSRREFLFAGGALLTLHAARLRGLSLPAAPTPLQVPACLASARHFFPGPLQKFLPKLDPGMDDFLCERSVAEIQPILRSWTAALCATPPDPLAIARHLAPQLSASPLQAAHTALLRGNGPLRIEKRIFAASEVIGHDAFTKEWLASIAAYSSIASCELEIFGARIAEQPSSAATKLETDIAFNLVGCTRDGRTEQRAGVWHLQWQRQEPSAPWLVTAWAADPEIRSQRSGPGFMEITGHCFAAGMPAMAQLAAGIDHWRTVIDGASGIDVFGNHGIAVGDIDGSGFDSLYVCQPSGLPNRLLRNRGDGSFEDITASSGTGLLDGTASALFADFRNRGRQDLLVVRSVGPMLFENMGDGRFEPRPDAFRFGRAPQGTFTGVAAADYNRDGLLDLYFCLYSYYKGLDHHQYPAPYYDAQNGPPNFLFRNRGDGTFEDVTVASGMDENNNRFSFAASWCDYDGDGWPELHVANDFGRKNLYRRSSDGTFHDVAQEAGVEDYGPGMSTCWLDIDNDGRQDLYVANMWLAEGQRITADDQFLPGVDPAIRAIYRKHNAGNSLFRNLGDGRFVDQTAYAGTAKAGWSWSSAAWDFDHDGWDDLYVANGFVSGPNRDDLQSFFWRQVAQHSFAPAYEPAWNAVQELLHSDFSWSGYQRNAFFANNRDGTFSPVAGALGLDLIDDCRAFALTDMDGDGRLEVVLKNRTGPQLRVLRNNLTHLGNSLTIRLRGRVSNRDAVGATVTIEAGAQKQSRFVSAGSGFASQHTKALLFGLGDSAGPVAISVRWPTGRVDHYEGLPPQHQVLIEEGSAQPELQPYRTSPHAAAEAAPAPLPAPATVETWLIAPLFGPDLDLTDIHGEKSRLSALRGRPVLLVFAQADCESSFAELEHLRNPPAELALFVVVLGDAATNEQISHYARQGMAIHVVDERTFGPWQIQYRYLFDRRRDMPLPTSFLLDATGAAIRVYDGVPDASRALGDARSAPATSEERLARALPFSGPSYSARMEHDYLTFGIAFSESNYADEAEAAFQHAITLHPELQVAWFNLGTIYLKKKMYPEARRALSEAVLLNPHDSDAWNNLGSVSGAEEKYDEAVEQFRRAALENPHHANAVENMMRVYQFQARAADAQKTLEELIVKAPDIAELHLALSMTLVAGNDLQAARRELERSIQLDPGNPDAVNNLGAVLLRMGLVNEALAQFEACLRMAPNFDRAAINVALLRNRAGRHDDATEVLREFLSRHPGDVAVRTALDRMEAP